MAIGTPIERRQATSAANQLATTTLTAATTIPAGETAILVVHCAANKTVASVADDTGANTWLVDFATTDGTRTLNFISCDVASAIVGASTVITITWSNATGSRAVYWLFEVPLTGATTLVFDKSAAAAGTSATPASGATATLAQAEEIAFGMNRITTASATIYTPDSPWLSPTTPFDVSVAPTACQYQIVAATTALNATGTWNASALWYAAVATYKGAAGAGDRPKHLPLIGVG